MIDQLTGDPLNRARERERGDIAKTYSAPEEVLAARASVKPQVLFLKSTHSTMTFAETVPLRNSFTAKFVLKKCSEVEQFFAPARTGECSHERRATA